MRTSLFGYGWAACLITILALFGCAPDPASRSAADGVASTDAPGVDIETGEIADLVLVNGKIVTLSEQHPEASALAMRDGLVQAVGDDADIRALANADTRIVNLAGRTVIPGLVDSHLHLVRGGRFYNAELRWDGVPSLEIALDMLRRQAERTPEGQWVRVIGGWSPDQFAERRMPTVEELNRAAPDTPVFVLFLYSQGLLNQAGLDALGVTAETPAPAGTRYELGADGRPTGRLLAEPNPTLLYQTISKLPPLSAEAQENSTRLFYRELNRLGLTSAIDAGGGGHLFPRDYTGTQSLARADEMPIRISYYLFPQRPGQEVEDFQAWMDEYEAGHNSAATLDHGFELEGGGEFLVWAAGDFENFLAERPDLAQRDYVEDLTTVTQMHVSKGWPLRIHATYDESIGRILDVFEAVDREEKEAGRAGFQGVRWAFDHAETLSQANLERIQALGGGVAIQSRLAYAGEAFLDRYGAEVAATAPPLRALLDAGIPVGAGTDGTRVGSYNPWPALAWLVTGRTVGGTQLASPQNRLTREEALRLYTVGSAWFSGEEDVKGILEPGCYADLVVLSDDYFTVPPEQISQLESVLTIVAGEPVYAAAEYADLVPWELEPIPEWSPVHEFPGYYRSARP